MKDLVITISLTGFLLVSLAAAALSYWRLGNVPYGFHIDEMGGSVDIGCMVTEGVDAHGVRNPVFSSLNYGTPKPPTFIYPAMVWAKFFGYSAPSLRALTVTAHLLGILGIFFLSKLFFGTRYAILTVVVASLSPWTWGMARVAFESLFAATFLIWGLYFFFKGQKNWMAIASGLFFAMAMYSYPPFRVQTPLMLLTLGVYSRFKQPRRASSWVLLAGAMVVPLLPLVQKTLNGELQGRFNTISIFSKDYLNTIHSSGSLGDIAAIFTHNYLMHFTPDFLFMTGDPSYVHSTRHFGILSWLDMLALGGGVVFIVMLFIKKLRDNNPFVAHKAFVFFLVINILIGVIPSAMTYTELPNSLRITGGWPFFCLFSGFLLWQICENWWVSWVVTLGVAIVFSVMYFNIYFKVFPQEGRGMFEYWTLEEANGLKTNEDWLKFVYIYRHEDYNARYFLMQYRHLSCSQSGKMWDGMRDFLASRGAY